MIAGDCCDASCTILYTFIGDDILFNMYCMHSIILISFFVVVVFAPVSHPYVLMHVHVSFIFSLFPFFSARFCLPSQNILSFRALPLPQWMEGSDVCLIHRKKTMKTTHFVCSVFFFFLIFIHLSQYRSTSMNRREKTS